MVSYKILEELEAVIEYKFKNSALLSQALTHSSFANERPNLESNERLEFLGDSVLGIIAAEYFFSSCKNHAEGELTKLRAAAVCEGSLCGFAKQIHLGDYIRFGKGEANTGGRNRPSILADAFEALIAAIYLDGGMRAAKDFVLKFITKSDTCMLSVSDYKTILQEVVQKNPEEKIAYFLTGESGPDHNKMFEVEVRLNSNVIGKGSGRSKKLAEQQAAKGALELMGISAL